MGMEVKCHSVCVNLTWTKTDERDEEEEEEREKERELKNFILQGL